MAEPVDPADDWAVTRGGARAVEYREYDPAADAHGAAEACSGMPGPRRVAEDGGRAVARRAWTLAGLAGRPVLRSLVVDGAEAWVVEAVTPGPAAETVWQVDTHKG